MGWSAHDLKGGWQLWTRGGLRGIYISDPDHTLEIELPEELLLMLAADHVLSARISALEQMDDSKEILGIPDD